MRATHRHLLVLGVMTLALLLCRASASAETLLIMVDSGQIDDDLLRRVAAQIESAGVTVEVANASLEDSAMLLGCEAEEDSCLDAIASAGNADSILILPGGDGPLVARRADQRRTAPAPSADDERAWRQALSGVLDLELSEAPGDSSDASVEGAGSESGSDAPFDDPSQAEVAPLPASSTVHRQASGKGFAFSRVKRRSWIVLGSGAAATGLGAILLSVAASRQDDVDAHPTESAADLKALRDLESSGKGFTLGGNLLLVGGSLAMLGGVGLMLLDNKNQKREAGLSIQPTVSGDRFGISLSWSSL